MNYIITEKKEAKVKGSHKRLRETKQLAVLKPNRPANSKLMETELAKLLTKKRIKKTDTIFIDCAQWTRGKAMLLTSLMKEQRLRGFNLDVYYGTSSLHDDQEDWQLIG